MSRQALLPSRPASLQFSVVERDADEELGTSSGRALPLPSAVLSRHLTSLAPGPFSGTSVNSTYLMRCHGEKKIPPMGKAFRRVKHASKKVHYHYRAGLEVSRQAPERGRSLPPRTVSLRDQYLLQGSRFLLLTGIVELLPSASGTNSEESLGREAC